VTEFSSSPKRSFRFRVMSEMTVADDPNDFLDASEESLNFNKHLQGTVALGGLR